MRPAARLRRLRTIKSALSCCSPPQNGFRDLASKRIALPGQLLLQPRNFLLQFGFRGANLRFRLSAGLFDGGGTIGLQLPAELPELVINLAPRRANGSLVFGGFGGGFG